MDNRQTSPVDKCPNDSPINKVREKRAYPVSVELQELGAAHLARRHHEFTMIAASDVTPDRHIEWLIREDQTRNIRLHEPRDDPMISSVAADEAMRPEPKKIIDPRDRRGAGAGFEIANLGVFVLAPD